MKIIKPFRYVPIIEIIEIILFRLKTEVRTFSERLTLILLMNKYNQKKSSRTLSKSDEIKFLL